MYYFISFQVNEIHLQYSSNKKNKTCKIIKVLKGEGTFQLHLGISRNIFTNAMWYLLKQSLFKIIWI